MALRSYREKRTSITTGTDVKDGAPRRIAQEQLIPQIARRSRNAVKVDGMEFYFFQRKSTGRRCSCFSVEQSPDGACDVCHGVGIVGSYDKYGCETEIGDITRPGLRCVNVEGNFDQRTRPVLFQLAAGARAGYFEFDLDVRSNVRMVDLIQLKDSVSDPMHARTSAQISCGGPFEPLNDASFSRALSARKLTVRITLGRDNTAVESPLVSHVLLRYRKLEKPTVMADVPRRRSSITMSDLVGISDTYEVINLFLADDLRAITTEDMFVMAVDGTRWKALDVSANKPGSILTSYDVAARKIHSYEPYAQIPI